jgi:hypothetical protein
LRRSIRNRCERGGRAGDAGALCVGHDDDGRAARADDQVTVGQRGSRAPPTCAIVLTMKPVGTCRFGSVAGAGDGAVVGGDDAVGGVIVGWLVGAVVGGASEPGAGALTNGDALDPPPLHDASATASNARPTSERSQS